MECLWSVFSCTAFFVTSFVVIWAWQNIKFARLAKTRPGEGFHSFCDAFPLEVPEDVIRTVYEYARDSWAGVTDFPVRSDDSIEGVYKADEDLDDAVWRILKSCGRKLPPEHELQEIKPIETVRDLVLFVASCPVGHQE